MTRAQLVHARQLSRFGAAGGALVGADSIADDALFIGMIGALFAPMILTGYLIGSMHVPVVTALGWGAGTLLAGLVGARTLGPIGLVAGAGGVSLWAISSAKGSK